MIRSAKFSQGKEGDNPGIEKIPFRGIFEILDPKDERLSGWWSVSGKIVERGHSPESFM